MTDAPTPVPSPLADKAKAALGSAVDFVSLPFEWAFNQLKSSWRPWVALAGLILGGLWFAQTQLGWHFPAWETNVCPAPALSQAEPLKLVPSMNLRLTEIATRAVETESISLTPDPPKVVDLPSVTAPVLKPAKGRRSKLPKPPPTLWEMLVK